MRTSRGKSWVWSVALALAAGCGSPLNEAAEELRPFASEAELNEYVDALRAKQEAARGGGWFGGGSPEAVADGAAPPAEPASTTNENITNNQEAGVDEGGIVKNVGEYLVVLRKGRLFAARVSTPGAPTQTDSVAVALNEELNQGVWYDELLVQGNLVIVVGYRYVTDAVGEADEKIQRIRGATEVNTFTLSEEGRFTREKTRFFESNDYYSGDNYASRLVDGKLILYMPYSAFNVVGASIQSAMPRHLSLHSGQKFIAHAPLFTWAEVIRPVVPPESPALHSLFQCDFTADYDLDCRARALLGSWARESYVSPSHVFVWTDDYVYGMSQSELSVSAHSAKGWPRDQFSFKQESGQLNVLVTTQDVDDEGRTTSERHVALLTLPLSAFDRKGQQTLDASRLRELAVLDAKTSVFENRYAEGKFVASLQSWSDGASSSILVHDVAGNTTETAPLGSVRLTRIEAIPGTGALLVGSEGTQLVLQTARLTGALELGAALRLDEAAEGESRSHAFFFKPTAQGGVFGLPVVADRLSGGGWWGSGAANIAFFGMDVSGGLSLAGAVSASTASGGQCETSCVDWYGNTRPIFLGERVFALMGSELQEAEFQNDQISEKGARLVLSF